MIENKMGRPRSMAFDTARSLYEHGLVKERTFAKMKLLHSTKRELRYPLEPVAEYTPREIRELRLREKLTPTEFALYLNATLKTIQEWEKGTKTPSAIEYKLLNVVKHKGLEAISYSTGIDDAKQGK